MHVMLHLQSYNVHVDTAAIQYGYRVDIRSDDIVPGDALVRSSVVAPHVHRFDRVRASRYPDLQTPGYNLTTWSLVAKNLLWTLTAPIASQQEQRNEAPMVTISTGRFMSPPYLNEPRLHRIVGDVHV